MKNGLLLRNCNANCGCDLFICRLANFIDLTLSRVEISEVDTKMEPKNCNSCGKNLKMEKHPIVVNEGFTMLTKKVLGALAKCNLINKKKKRKNFLEHQSSPLLALEYFESTVGGPSMQ